MFFQVSATSQREIRARNLSRQEKQLWISGKYPRLLICEPSDPVSSPARAVINLIRSKFNRDCSGRLALDTPPGRCSDVSRSLPG